MATTVLPRTALSLPRLWRVARWALLFIVVAGLALGARAITARRAPGPRFQTVALDRGPIAAKITASGTVSALVTVNVGSQVSGRIETLRVDFGSRVTRGQLVATIEPSLFKAAVGQARANHLAAQAALARAEALKAQADKQFARAKSLHAEGLMSGADYDSAEANVGVAEADIASARSSIAQTRAALDQAELNLHYTNIVSPIDGVVISRNVDVGQTVAATLQAPTLFIIAQDLTHMQVDTNVAEADVGKIRPGMDVTFTVDAYPTRTFHGKVRQVRDNAQTIQNVVTYDAVIDIDNREGQLKPGMTANVTCVYAEKQDVLRAPNAALRFKPDQAALTAMKVTRAPTPTRPDERVLWVVSGPQATPSLVHVGISDGAITEITDGAVAPGDHVATEIAPEAK